jgi:hypothetical protein
MKSKMDVTEALDVIQKELNESDGERYGTREALDVLNREFGSGSGSGAQLRDITIGDLTDMTSGLTQEQLGGVDPGLADFVAIKLIWDTSEKAPGAGGIDESQGEYGLIKQPVFPDPLGSGFGRSGRFDRAGSDRSLEDRVSRLEDAVQRLVDLFETAINQESDDSLDRRLDELERKSR